MTMNTKIFKVSIRSTSIDGTIDLFDIIRNLSPYNPSKIFGKHLKT